MPAINLPQNPSLEHLRNRAKALLRASRTGDDAALALVREFHPAHAGDPGRLRLSDAQLVVARRYGFASWRALHQHLDVVDRYSRSPHREPEEADTAAEFLRLACLTYGSDHPSRWAQARRLLDEHPEIAGSSLHTAAAAGDVGEAHRLLAADSGAADREGGPYRWSPLLYLTYSRVDAGDPVAVARLLLDGGADPNAGYLWEGLPSPFTALTGALGGGEDTANQPPHPAWLRLARLLLDAGADPNDTQALYNRQFEADNRHLELLLEYGLGRGDGGPWHARLGSAHPSPAQLLQDQLLNAARENWPERARLALRAGVDVHGLGTRHPLLGGRTAYELAVLHGNAGVAELLIEAGAATRLRDAVEELIAACMRVDESTVDKLLAADPALARQAVQRHPDVPIRAAGLDRPEAVRLAVRIGFDVNHRGRITALHRAAYDGNVEMAKVLVELGADPATPDADFGSTPLGWARHNRRTEMTAYLSTLE